MKNLISIIILITFLFITPQVFAESSASVEVNNNINSSSTSQSSIDSHTDITVEVDGEVTTYSSDEPNQKIEVKASDGQSSIKVDGVEKSDSSNSEEINSPTPTDKLSPTPTPSPTSSSIKEMLIEKFDFIEKFVSFLDSLRR